MQPTYPAPLRRGDRIAVTAPSSGVEPPCHGRLDLVIGHLRDQGWQVEEGRCLRSQSAGASAPADARAAELMDLLLRDDIAAVIPPWGGELAVELLDRLDWTALRQARPKWMLGFSDTSTLLVALTLHLGWATAHGPGLMDLAPGQQDPLTAHALSRLAIAAGGSFTQQQSTHWQLQWTDFADAPDTTFQLTEPTRWWPLDGSSSAIECRGRLIGGCIDTLMPIAGAPHGDVAGFIRSCGSDGTLLYLENCEQAPTALVRALHRLRWAGWLDGIAGLLIGRASAPASTGATDLRQADALRSALGELRCPVLVDVDIGHRPPQLLLINGARATVRWSASGGGSVEQTLA